MLEIFPNQFLLNYRVTTSSGNDVKPMCVSVCVYQKKRERERKKRPGLVSFRFGNRVHVGLPSGQQNRQKKKKFNFLIFFQSIQNLGRTIVFSFVSELESIRER